LKAVFLINLTGLTLGLSSALLIYLWVIDELRVDKFLANDARIFQVLQNSKSEGGIQTAEATPGLLAKALAIELPEIEFSAAVIPASFNISKGILSNGDIKIKSSGQYVTSDFLKIFSYEIIEGDQTQLLADRKSIVISEKLTEKLFKSSDAAVGQTIEWQTQEIKALCTVTGVFRTPPPTATKQFDFLLPYALFEDLNPSDGWGSSSPHTYVLLKNSSSERALSDKIAGFIKRHDVNSNNTLVMQQFSDRYLRGRYENGKPSGGRITYVRLFSIIGSAILLIACINFMNLSTASSLDKMKAVGIRKILGASRRTLAMTQLFESTVMAFIALVLGILIADLFMGTFNTITGKNLSLSFDRATVISLLLIAGCTGLLSGSYPAFYLSSKDAAKSLKGILSTSASEVFVRKALVVFQFTIAIILITGVGIVFLQMKLIQSKSLGFTRDQIVYFSTTGMTSSAIEEIRKIPGVLKAGGGRLLPGNPLGGTNDLHWEGKSVENDLFVSNFWMSYGLVETLDMEIVAGRSFTENKNLLGQIIFNELAIKRMNLQNPIGKKVTIGGDEKEIVGIVRDFNFESMYEPVKPCALLAAPIEYSPYVSLKIQAGSEQATLGRLQERLKEIHPNEPFEFRFMDEDYQKLYSAELRTATLSRYFAAMAIFISSMGLLGLAIFIAQRRKKEIGIRKVLGSSSLGIVYLLSLDFTKAILLAIVFAIPTSYLIALYWLDNFVVRITLAWWYFLIAGATALIIGWVTVGTQSLRAALANPVDSLKND